jgi:cytochrome c oxidase cbb3-type subunit I/II
MLHIVNSLEIPVSMTNSYPIWGGIQDALVQWWYGHNAVAFFLTTPFLGLMYYYVPKAVNRPIYSYNLSIVHFWALVFIYIWAGPHHLLNTSLPDWAQTVGMVFSVMLWAPSWGGMINGLLTLRGCWHMLTTEPIVKFFVGAITFYGMSTFEGPLLSIKSVSSLGHYTDWIVGHVHSGALGWNGLMSFGMAYYLVPKLWNSTLYSKKLANLHFWLALSGALLYYTSMVAAGITQGLMWQAIDETGRLVYPDFVETVTRIVPLYRVRALSGLIFFAGYFVMMYNFYKTIKAAQSAPSDTEVRVQMKDHEESSEKESGHRRIEGLGTIFTVLSILAVLSGSIISIYPIINVQQYVQAENTVSPWTPLELAGRDIYVKEGCYTCHSQQIRKLPFDVIRFGKASTIEESQWDRPFQWGSKRTGPDLARVGKKYPDLWHYRHMINPREIVEKSIMPSYSWLVDRKTDFISLRRKVSVMHQLGVPYDQDTLANADIIAQKQALEIASQLEKEGAPSGLEKQQIVALIAYLQALGQKGLK